LDQNYRLFRKKGGQGGGPKVELKIAWARIQRLLQQASKKKDVSGKSRPSEKKKENGPEGT